MGRFTEAAQNRDIRGYGLVLLLPALLLALGGAVAGELILDNWVIGAAIGFAGGVAAAAVPLAILYLFIRVARIG